MLPVVTQTPASVLLYTSFSSITPWPFSCWKTDREETGRQSRQGGRRRPPSPSTHHVDSSVLPVVDLVVPYDGAAVGSDLDAGQGVAVNVIALYQAPAVTEDVHAALVAVKYSVSAARKTETLKVSH